MMKSVFACDSDNRGEWLGDSNAKNEAADWSRPWGDVTGGADKALWVCRESKCRK